MKAKICILGLPGSGKTTVSDKLARHMRMKYFDVGAILRSQADEDQHIKSVHQEGGLVNSNRVLGIFDQALQEERWLLSGSPRKPEEAEYILDHPSWKEDPGYLVYLKLDPEIAKARLLARGRHDDTEQAIDKRLMEHFSITRLSAEKFEAQGRAIIVDASKDKLQVYLDIIEELKKRSYGLEND